MDEECQDFNYGYDDDYYNADDNFGYEEQEYYAHN